MNLCRHAVGRDFDARDPFDLGVVAKGLDLFECFERCRDPSRSKWVSFFYRELNEFFGSKLPVGEGGVGVEVDFHGGGAYGPYVPRFCQ